MYHLLAHLTTLDDGLDIAEACGGEARTGQRAVRRRLSVGENFGLVAGCDLDDEDQQRAVE
eukprot:3711477-Pyramimonas_sp.AAC.1